MDLRNTPGRMANRNERKTQNVDTSMQVTKTPKTPKTPRTKRRKSSDKKKRSKQKSKETLYH